MSSSSNLASLRLGDERYRIRAGDCVGFPAGQRAGPCLVNEGDKPFRFIMIGDRAANETCVYPDSGKVMVRALKRIGWLEKVPYMEGEPQRPKVFDLIDEGRVGSTGATDSSTSVSEGSGRR